MLDDSLLTQYTQNNSEAAFAKLLAKHLPLVYRTCYRELGAEALAEDAAQVVFLLLARKAKSLHASPSLAGWLYKTSVFVAKDIRKQEARRTRREEAAMQEAIHAQTMPSNEWETVEPFLNSALSALKPADRDAVLLRFLEGHTLAETGALLGISEDAARMRCSRALDKMRRYLTARGAAITTVTLAALLTTEAARPVSAQAVSVLTTRMLNALATGPSPNVLLLSKGISHTMKIIKIKYAALAAVLLLSGVVIPLTHAVPPKPADLPDTPQTVRSLLDQAQSFTPSVLASFNGMNGTRPVGGLILIGSTLYGTTEKGGAYRKGDVFSIPTSGGTPTVLATFNSTNGSRPNGSLTLSGSTLYGTTENGGDNNKGTVFSLPTTGGTPTVLTSFSTEIGYFPEAGLTLNGSTLYGTTSIGGPHNDGTVFSVPTTGGTPTILANFNGANGKSPVGNLTLSGNTLYGTTNLGGGVHYAGTVFSVPTTGGTPIVLATFNAVNGFGPNGKLTLIGSTLYGTTQYGGSYRAGTVFAVPTTGGTLTDIFSFNRTNGAFPIGGLTLSGSTLYGTTAAGGAADYSAAGFEHGIVFSISATGNTPIATK